MNHLSLITKNLGRKKLRTCLTIVSVFVAFLLFGLLFSLEQAFSSHVELAGQDRLITLHKLSLVESLPVRYLEKIKATPGVNEITHGTWFGGYYQDDRNPVTTYAVDKDTYLKVYSELQIEPEQYNNWLKSRAAVLVGEAYASRFGWKVGDVIPLSSSIWFNRSTRNMTWEVEIAGILKGKTKEATTQDILLGYEYLNESRVRSNDTVGWYGFTVNDPSKNDMLAKQIDEKFANSDSETKTSTEKAFIDAFADQLGDIGKIVTAVVGAVFFTILLIAGNTMALAARERMNEMAVLKTIGFPKHLIFSFVISESLLIATIGGVLGLTAAWILLAGIQESVGSILPNIVFSQKLVASGLLLMFLTGVATGIIPAWKIANSNIVEGLKKG